MKKNVHIILCCMLSIFSFRGTAQDIHFSQFFEAPLLRNPALAGLFSGDYRVQAVYRTQWQSVTVPFQTTSVNGEVKLPVGKGEDFLTLGGQVLQDKAGTIALTSTHLLPAINYHKSLSAERNSYLSLGFMAGWVQRRLDITKMTTNSQYDGGGYNGGLSTGENLASPSYSYFDGTAGLSFNTQLGEDEASNMFVGIAYHHFNKNSRNSFYNATNLAVQPKWVYSVGAKMAATETAYITLHADYTRQGVHSELIAGGMVSYQLDNTEHPRYFIHGGGFLRVKDAIIPVLKLELKPVAFSFSYDANVSALSSASKGRGGFEMGIAYQKYLSNDNTSREAVRCPRF